MHNLSKSKDFLVAAGESWTQDLLFISPVSYPIDHGSNLKNLCYVLTICTSISSNLLENKIQGYNNKICNFHFDFSGGLEL